MRLNDQGALDLCHCDFMGPQKVRGTKEHELCGQLKLR